MERVPTQLIFHEVLELEFFFHLEIVWLNWWYSNDLSKLSKWYKINGNNIYSFSTKEY